MKKNSKNSVESENKRIGDAARIFSFGGGLLLLAILLILALDSFPDWKDYRGWEAVLFKIMLSYLFFVSLRTAILIFLSFADRFFQKTLKPMQSSPLVSVIVPCFNEQAVVVDAVQSVLKLNYQNFEVLVIDDGSTDDTLKLAKELEAENSRVRVIHQQNQGKAEALNRGISEALGEYVLCVDADSRLDLEVINKGLPFFTNDPQLSAVAGSVRIGNEVNLLTVFQSLEYLMGLNFHKSAQSFLGIVSIVPGPIGLFKREILLKVGAYRSSTFAEDCDLTIRLLMAHYRVVYCPEMVAVTEAPEDFESLLKQRYRWSRGTLQALKANIQWLWSPLRSPRNFLVLLYLIVETMLIPCANFLFAFIFIEHAVLTESASVLGPFFIHLTLLDVVITSYSVMSEQKAGAFVFLAAINRLTYGLSMEVLRFFSIFDEIFGLPMNWNKLERKGL